MINTMAFEDMAMQAKETQAMVWTKFSWAPFY